MINFKDQHHYLLDVRRDGTAKCKWRYDKTEFAGIAQRGECDQTLTNYVQCYGRVTCKFSELSAGL